MPAETDADVEVVALADLDAAAGLAPIPPDERTGAIYYSEEQFLSALDDQPYDRSNE